MAVGADARTASTAEFTDVRVRKLHAVEDRRGEDQRGKDRGVELRVLRCGSASFPEVTSHMSFDVQLLLFPFLFLYRVPYVAIGCCVNMFVLIFLRKYIC